jgi:hypothetical protein
MATLIPAKYGLDAVVKFPAIFKDSKAEVIVDSDDLIGIEVEIENAGAFMGQGLNKAWMVKGDGSLRNEGAEFVTRPISARLGPVALDYLLNQYLSKDVCCFSPRTSVHVHLNMQDMTDEQTFNYILLYSIYEPQLYEFVGKSRAKNIYCVPVGETNILACLKEYGETRQNSWMKYTGLNTAPLRSFGTIEFRHMHGTFDVYKLSIWLNFIVKMKDYVRKNTTTQIRAMVAAMDDSFRFDNLMADIFGEFAKHLNYKSPESVNYLGAKHALVGTRNAMTVRGQATSDSPFYSFKG